MDLAIELLKAAAILCAVLFGIGCVIAAFTARTIFRTRKHEGPHVIRTGSARIIDFAAAARGRPTRR
jgi:hypothetical protein